jgi:hypothetical protein
MIDDEKRGVKRKKVHLGSDQVTWRSSALAEKEGESGMKG